MAHQDLARLRSAAWGSKTTHTTPSTTPGETGSPCRMCASSMPSSCRILNPKESHHPEAPSQRVTVHVEVKHTVCLCLSIVVRG